MVVSLNCLVCFLVVLFWAFCCLFVCFVWFGPWFDGAQLGPERWRSEVGGLFGGHGRGQPGRNRRNTGDGRVCFEGDQKFGGFQKLSQKLRCAGPFWGFLLLG